MKAQDIQSERILLLGKKHFSWQPPLVMGILNASQDSFYKNSRIENEKSLLNQAEKMMNDGAFSIDLGGISSRPGSVLISPEEELNRLIPVIKTLVKSFPELIISVDTFRSEIANACLDSGASIINDISGGRWDEQIFSTCKKHEAGYILMHSRGSFENLHQVNHYEKGIVYEVREEIKTQISKAEKYGLKNIFIDPGFGFSKNVEQNFELLNGLEDIYDDDFTEDNYPLIVGISRKSKIWKTLNSNPENALNGTTVLNTIALLKGASILRVHDVKEACEIVLLISQLNSNIL